MVKLKKISCLVVFLLFVFCRVNSQTEILDLFQKYSGIYGHFSLSEIDTLKYKLGTYQKEMTKSPVAKMNNDISNFDAIFSIARIRNLELKEEKNNTLLFLSNIVDSIMVSNKFIKNADLLEKNNFRKSRILAYTPQLTLLVILEKDPSMGVERVEYFFNEHLTEEKISNSYYLAQMRKNLLSYLVEFYSEDSTKDFISKIKKSKNFTFTKEEAQYIDLIENLNFLQKNKEEKGWSHLSKNVLNKFPDNNFRTFQANVEWTSKLGEMFIAHEDLAFSPILEVIKKTNNLKEKYFFFTSGCIYINIYPDRVSNKELGILKRELSQFKKENPNLVNGEEKENVVDFLTSICETSGIIQN